MRRWWSFGIIELHCCFQQNHLDSLGLKIRCWLPLSTILSHMSTSLPLPLSPISLSSIPCWSPKSFSSEYIANRGTAESSLSQLTISSTPEILEEKYLNLYMELSVYLFYPQPYSSLNHTEEKLKQTKMWLFDSWQWHLVPSLIVSTWNAGFTQSFWNLFDLDQGWATLVLRGLIGVTLLPRLVSHFCPSHS